MLASASRLIETVLEWVVIVLMVMLTVVVIVAVITSALSLVDVLLGQVVQLLLP